MRKLLLATAFVLGIPALAGAQQVDDVTVENFGTVDLVIDFQGSEPHLATEFFTLRRSDDGDKTHKVLEQWNHREGRFKDSVKTDQFFPSKTIHDQFDTDAVPFTKDFFRELNAALGSGALAHSEKLASEGSVSFKLTWNPKGHGGRSEVVRLEGQLDLGAEHALRFSPTDDEGKRAKPLLDLLLAQMARTDRATDEVQSSVILFGKVKGTVLSDTSWSCSLTGPRAATGASEYRVSADTDASLRALLERLDGKSAIVRAVLRDDGTAKVLGVFSTIGWDEPILAAPGGARRFAKGGTLMNLTDDEAAEIVQGAFAKNQVAAEVTSVDARSGFAAIRAPNRKGAGTPDTGFVKAHDVNVFAAASGRESYDTVSLDELARPSETAGVANRLAGTGR